MRAKDCKEIRLLLTPEEISMLKNCEAISIKMKSTTGDTASQMWVYTDKFLHKLGYD